MKQFTTHEKTILVVGLEPAPIDFSKPGSPPGMTENVLADITSFENDFAALGYSAQRGMPDFGETAEPVVLKHLKQKPCACVMIGAGVKANPSNFLLFEKLVNVTH